MTHFSDKMLINSGLKLMAVTPKQEKLIRNSEVSTQTEHTPSSSNPSQNSKAIFLQQAGALGDDSSLVDLRSSIYQARGRSETDDDVSS